MRGTLLLLAGCAAAPTPAGPPDADTLRRGLAAAGLKPHDDEGALIATCDDGGQLAAYAVADPRAALLSTAVSELARAADLAATGRLLTTALVLNHELDVGRVALDPTTGGISLDVALPAGDATTVALAATHLCAAAAAVRARLDLAAAPALPVEAPASPAPDNSGP